MSSSRTPSRSPRATVQPIYRIALLSNAMHQDNYARVFARHPRLRIAVVVDEPNQEPYVVARNRAIAERYGVPYVEGLDALTGTDVDVVSIGAQIERRGRLAVEVARLGKHLWLDKPPVATLAEAEELSAVVSRVGIRSIVVSFNAARWLADVRAAIAEGKIGELRALHLDFHFAKGNAAGLANRLVPAGGGPREAWTFRDPDAATDPTESSHNVIAKRELAEIGWYPLAVAQHLCPQPVRSVFATAGAYFFPEHRDLGIEDFATLTLTLSDGPIVTISTGRIGRRSYPGGSRMALRVVGTRGTIVVDGGRPIVSVYGGEPTGGRASTIVAGGDSAGLTELLENFVACLDGREASIQDARAGCEVVRTIAAAYDSIAMGDVVALEAS